MARADDETRPLLNAKAGETTADHGRYAGAGPDPAAG